MKNVTLSLDAATTTKINDLQKLLGANKSEIVRRAVDQYYTWITSNYQIKNTNK